MTRLERPAPKGLAVALGALLVAACSGDRDLPRNEQTVGGLTIELGVLPAELVRGEPTAQGDPNAMHGGTPHSGSHHIVVALFDAKSGARVSDARIRAGVGDRSYDHEPDTWLEPMQIAGTTTYGNYFRIPGSGLWRIHLEIYRPGAAQPTRADFAYEHPGP